MIKDRKVRDKIGEKHPREKSRCKEVSIVEGERRPVHFVPALLLNVILRSIGGPRTAAKATRTEHRTAHHDGGCRACDIVRS